MGESRSALSSKIRNLLRSVAVKALFFLIEHRSFLFALTCVSVLIFLFFVSSASISNTISLFLLSFFLSGTGVYVYRAFHKISKAKEDADLRLITIRECESIKRNLNVWFPMLATLSGIGLATMTIPSNQTSLPSSLVVIAGMAVESMTTATFALLFWWVFFFLIERYPLDTALQWAGMFFIVPSIAGAYATLSIAKFFGLNTLQDFIVAFVPYLIVYYVMDKSIPDYTLTAYTSYDREISNIKKNIWRIEEEINKENFQSRKTHLDLELSRLKVKETRLQRTKDWLGIGLNRITELQDRFKSFHGRIENTRKTYLEKVTNPRCKEIAILVEREVFIVKEKQRQNFQLISHSSIPKKTLNMINQILSIRVAFSHKRFFRPHTAFNFNRLLKSMSIIAIKESTEKDIPVLCQEFDKKTLREYFPARACFEINNIKYGCVIYQICRYPNFSLLEEFQQAKADLLTSLLEFRKRIQERIDNYITLEKEHPDCYVVKGFRSLFGLLGVSALRESLRTLQSCEKTLSDQLMTIEETHKSIRTYVEKN